MAKGITLSEFCRKTEGLQLWLELNKPPNIIWHGNLGDILSDIPWPKVPRAKRKKPKRG